MTIVVLAVCILVVLFVLFIVVRFRPKEKLTTEIEDDYTLNDRWLIELFENHNIIIEGAIGTGKDTIFAHVINQRNEKHYSNMPYDENTTVISLKDLAVGDNTFEDVLDGTITKSAPQFEIGYDTYITDGALFLPSQYDSTLDKMYPSLSLFYPISRQLYQMHIHINIQAIGRLYKKLREQADCYMRCVGCVKHDDYMIVELIRYDSYKAITSNVMPLQLATDKDRALFKANNGTIERRFIKVFYDELQYDTYHFRGVFLETQKEKIKGIEAVIKHV